MAVLVLLQEGRLKWFGGYCSRCICGSSEATAGGEAVVALLLTQEVALWWCWGQCRRRGFIGVGTTAGGDTKLVLGSL